MRILNKLLEKENNNNNEKLLIELMDKRSNRKW